MAIQHNEENKMDLEIVMNKLENFSVVETHEVFESYKFHLWKYKPSENSKTYVAALRQLAKNKQTVILVSYETN